MKKLCALLLLVMLLMNLPICGGCAETAQRDGLEVMLTTDKEVYDALETVYAELTVKNTNSFDVGNVTMKVEAPEGYLLSDGEETRIGTLSAGETQKLLVTVREATADTPLLPQTGDGSHGMIWTLLLVAAVSVMCTLMIRSPQAKRVISLFLCMAIIAPYAMQVAPVLAQESDEDKEIVVENGVTIEEKGIVLTGVVSYELGVGKGGQNDPRGKAGLAGKVWLCVNLMKPEIYLKKLETKLQRSCNGIHRRKPNGGKNHQRQGDPAQVSGLLLR